MNKLMYNFYSNPNKLLENNNYKDDIITDLVILIKTLYQKNKYLKNNILNNDVNNNINQLEINHDYTEYDHKIKTDIYNTCEKYFNDKKNDIDLYSQDIHEYNLLKHKLEKIKNYDPQPFYAYTSYYGHHIKANAILLKILIKLIYIDASIKFNCNQIIQKNNIQTGGSNKNLKSKIEKYILKYSLNSNNSKYNKKLNNYIYQLGGDNLDTPSIKSILSDRFSLLTSLSSYHKLKIPLDIKNCIDPLNFSDDLDKILQTDIDTKYFCQKNYNFNSPSLILSNNFYQLARSLKDVSTETFANQTLNSEKDYKLLCDYIYFELLSIIYEFITLYNEKFLTKQIDYDCIYLFYKSGNTTRFYISLLYSHIKTIDPNYSSDNLNKLLKEYKLGDFDYNVTIDFKKLASKGFDNNEIEQLIKYLNQIIILGLHKIKKNIKLFLESDISTKFAENLKKNYFFNDDLNVKLKEIISKINDSDKTSNDDKIKNFTINKIKIFNYEITKDNIIPDFDNIKIHKKSILLEYGNTDLTSVDLINTFLYNNNLDEYIPESFEMNNIYISLLQKFKVYNYKTIGFMNIYRLKFNNYLDVTIEKNKGNENAIKYIPVEILDVSIDKEKNIQELMTYHIDIMNLSRNDDNKILKFQMVYYSNSAFLEKDKHEIFKNLDIKKSSIYLPSSEYIFFDLLFILQDSIFPWADKKYEKRIKRLFLIMIIVLTKTKSIDMIEKLFMNLIELMQGFINQSDINSKVNLINLSNISLHNYTKNKIVSNQIIMFNNYIINEWLDKFISVYYETIINIYYLFNDNIDSKLLKFCKQNFYKSKDLDINDKLDGYTNIQNFKYYKNEIKSIIKSLIEFEVKIIDIIKNDILPIIADIKKTGIKDFTKISSSYLY
jgi:hypothetical protein